MLREQNDMNFIFHYQLYNLKYFFCSSESMPENLFPMKLSSQWQNRSKISFQIHENFLPYKRSSCFVQWDLNGCIRLMTHFYWEMFTLISCLSGSILPLEPTLFCIKERIEKKIFQKIKQLQKLHGKWKKLTIHYPINLGGPTRPKWRIIQLYPGDCWTDSDQQKLHMLMGSKSLFRYALMGTDVYSIFLASWSQMMKKQGLRC